MERWRGPGAGEKEREGPAARAVGVSSKDGTGIGIAKAETVWKRCGRWQAGEVLTLLTSSRVDGRGREAN